MQKFGPKVEVEEISNSLSQRNQTANETKQFKETKTWISKSHLTDKAFKGTVVNQAFPSVHGGSLKIMLTALLRFRIPNPKL